MKQAAKLFIREADFTAFSSNRLLHPVRRVIRSEIQETDDEVTYTVEANGFLKYMVRTMMGTLLEVGKCRIQPEEITALFERRTRSLTSPTAPAKGLCLIRVKYPRST
jgi:tRNA pseudouridine38-40 synthase